MFGLRLKVHNKAYTWIYPLLLVALLVTSRGYSTTPGCIHCEQFAQDQLKFSNSECARGLISFGVVLTSCGLAVVKSVNACVHRPPLLHIGILNLFYAKIALSSCSEFWHSAVIIAHNEKIKDKDQIFIKLSSRCDHEGHRCTDVRKWPSPWYSLAIDVALLYGSSYVKLGNKPR